MTESPDRSHAGTGAALFMSAHREIQGHRPRRPAQWADHAERFSGTHGSAATFDRYEPPDPPVYTGNQQAAARSGCAAPCPQHAGSTRPVAPRAATAALTPSDTSSSLARPLPYHCGKINGDIAASPPVSVPQFHDRSCPEAALILGTQTAGLGGSPIFLRHGSRWRCVVASIPAACSTDGEIEHSPIPPGRGTGRIRACAREINQPCRRPRRR